MHNRAQFKKVDKKVCEHKFEKRGFVSVPLDYSNPNSETIEVFYRLIPAYDSSVEDRTKPIIVVINGGPGYPASVYRKLDFDYATGFKNDGFDRFKYLLKSYRILLVDQRGTDGCSAPIDMDNSNLDYQWIAQKFSSDNQAKDYLAVINEVIPGDEPFFIIAQSYGGIPGMQYLSLPNVRRPNGIVFSCSALPHEDVAKQMLGRRRAQYHLNLQLKSIYPDIEKRIERTKKHLSAIGIDPTRIHGIYEWLGSVRFSVSGKNRVVSDAKEDMGYDSKHGYHQVRGLPS